MITLLRAAWVLFGTRTAEDWLAGMTRERIPVPKKWNI